MPARAVGHILADYLRVSSDHFPYSFLATTKSTGFTSILPWEKPIDSINLVAADGTKQYKLFKFHVQLMETQECLLLIANVTTIDSERVRAFTVL